MERNSKKYILTDSMEWEELGGGVSRKMLGYDNQIMMVLVKFEKGAEGTPHSHFHTQATYVAKGKFEFEIDGVKQIVSEGDGVYIEPNLVHGALCLEPGNRDDRNAFCRRTLPLLRQAKTVQQAGLPKPVLPMFHALFDFLCVPFPYIPRFRALMHENSAQRHISSHSKI